MKLNPMHKRKYVAGGSIAVSFLIGALMLANEPNEGSPAAQNKRVGHLLDILPSALILLTGRMKYISLPNPETAIHEAGHVISQVYRPDGLRMHIANVVHIFNRAGAVLSASINEKSEPNDLQKYNSMVISVSGKIAEEVYFGSKHKPQGFEHDYKIATGIACNLLNVEPSSPEVKTLIEQAENEARHLIQEKLHEVELVAKALLDKKLLRADEIYALLGKENPHPDHTFS